MKNLLTFFSSLIFLVFTFSTAQASQLNHPNLNTEMTITYLIGQVENSGLVFIRNGSEYSGKQAAKHLRDKYGYFKAEIKSPQDFIKLCASKSLVSGKPYLVQTGAGNIPTGKWLEEKLSEYMNELNHS